MEEFWEKGQVKYVRIVSKVFNMLLELLLIMFEKRGEKGAKWNTIQLQ